MTDNNQGCLGCSVLLIEGDGKTSYCPSGMRISLVGERPKCWREEPEWSRFGVHVEIPIPDGLTAAQRALFVEQWEEFARKAEGYLLDPNRPEVHHCRDCKHWDLSGSPCCAKSKEYCKSALEGHPADPAEFRTAYAYGLFTGPDFGCVHWEEKKC